MHAGLVVYFTRTHWVKYLSSCRELNLVSVLSLLIILQLTILLAVNVLRAHLFSHSSKGDCEALLPFDNFFLFLFFLLLKLHNF